MAHSHALRRLFAALMIAALASCASMDDMDETTRADQLAPKSGAARYSSMNGDPVGAIPDATLHDPARNRDVALSIEYPMTGNAHPLILFSPAYGGSTRDYVGLSAYWASKGYVVIKVAHADATQRASGAEDFWSKETPASWQNRVRDLSLVLDSIEHLETEYPELKGKIDRAKVGVAGHSYGAFTAMLMGGVTTWPGPVSYADPRVKAVVAMSPQGSGSSRGLTRDSFAALKVPALFMTGTEDRGASEAETPQWRREAFELSPAGEKWLAVVSGARHGSFTGRLDDFLEAQAREEAAMPAQTIDPMTGQILQRRPSTRAENELNREATIFNAIRAVSLMFWDTYLNSDAAARAELEKVAAWGNVELKKK